MRLRDQRDGEDRGAPTDAVERVLSGAGRLFVRFGLNSLEQNIGLIQAAADKLAGLHLTLIIEDEHDPADLP